ncbi:hypothetical protein C1646_682187 [Rhizophagus diaphanus]|nr:hypothetical protein C1646_682187 [Rhizophagus diaphanus] [Rhizophagus sp. MUCL 43196]
MIFFNNISFFIITICTIIIPLINFIIICFIFIFIFHINFFNKINFFIMVIPLSLHTNFITTFFTNIIIIHIFFSSFF